MIESQTRPECSDYGGTTKLIRSVETFGHLEVDTDGVACGPIVSCGDARDLDATSRLPGNRRRDAASVMSDRRTIRSISTNSRPAVSFRRLVAYTRDKLSQGRFLRDANCVRMYEV